MLYEFAMTPDLFDASVIKPDQTLSIVLVEVLKGLTDNGLLANLHKDRWFTHISEDRIKSLPSGLKSKIISCMNILSDRHRIVRHPLRNKGIPSNDIEWLELALVSHQAMPFHGIILSKDLLNIYGNTDSSFIELSGCLDSSQWQSRRRTISLNKCEADYRSILTVILRHAKSLNLVDPYLNSEELRFFSILDICSDVMGKRWHAPLLGRIHVHAELKRQKPDNKSLDEYLLKWEQKLKPLKLRSGHRFKVFLWDSLPGSETLHDRYILTDQCGIMVPGGLDCRISSHPNSTNWGLLDEADRIRRLNDYDPTTSPFKLIGQREVF